MAYRLARAGRPTTRRPRRLARTPGGLNEESPAGPAGTAQRVLSDTILPAASRWDSLAVRILSLVFLKLTRSTAFVDRLCVVLVGGAGAVSHCTCHTRGRWTIQIIRGRGDLFSRCGRKRTLLCAGDAGARNECDGRCRQKPLGVHKNLQLFECTPTFERLARSVSKTQTIRAGAVVSPACCPVAATPYPVERSWLVPKSCMCGGRDP